jgi:enoyl-CoA hydratase
MHFCLAVWATRRSSSARVNWASRLRICGPHRTVSFQPGIETKKFLEKLYFALNDIQYRMGKPTIAAIDGAVRAGGMTIAISCDMIIAGDASTFGYPEIDVGLIPAIHFVQLPRLIGKHQAFGPLFLGDSFDAATAYRMAYSAR